MHKWGTKCVVQTLGIQRITCQKWNKSFSYKDVCKNLGLWVYGFKDIFWSKVDCNEKKVNNLLKNKEWKYTCIWHEGVLWYADSNMHKLGTTGLCGPHPQTWCLKNNIQNVDKSVINIFYSPNESFVKFICRLKIVQL